MRTLETSHFVSHDGVVAVLPPLAGAERPAQGRHRAVPSRPRAFGPHGASGRRARHARLRFLRLGCPRPRRLARRARRRAELRRLGARRAELRRPYRHRPRLRARRHRRGRAERRAPCWPRPGCTTMRRRSAALVLASPAFKVKLYVPFARPGLKLMQRFQGNFFVQSYVKANFLTHDEARQRSFDEDPLITRAISVRHPARPLRGGRARRRRRPCHHGADAAADLRRRLGGASRARSTASTKISAPPSRSATSCRASSTTRSARRTARSPSARSGASSERAFRRAAGTAGPARCRSPERHARRGGPARLALAAGLAARVSTGPLRGLACKATGLVSDGIRLGHQHRLRFRHHARLRLSQHRLGAFGASGA